MDKYIAAFFTILLIVPVFIGLWKGIYRLYERWEWKRIKRSLNNDSQ